MAVETTPVSYDEVPYPGAALPDTNPSAISVIAKLFGMEPALPPRARVLELGCGTGANLLPLAELYPESSFFGVDLSAVQVGMARTRARKLGLKNVRFEQMDILDFPKDAGEFDYIICYGVYSWVPKDVREKILEVCAEHLAPQGVASVSFNCYPGWHLRGMVRDMFVYHTRNMGTPDEKVDGSLALLAFLKSTAEQMAPRYSDLAVYAQVLEREAAMLNGRARHYFVHEHLEGVNQPFYLHEFVTRSAAHGLAFLGDVRLSTMTAQMLPPDTLEQLEALSPDFVTLEQYRDFVTNRTFRNALLCRAEQPINRDVDGDAMAGLSFTCNASPVVEGDEVYVEDVPKMRSHRGGSVVALHSLLSYVALGYLLEVAPAWVPFEHLLGVARERIAEAGEENGEPEDDARRLGQALASCLSADVVEAAIEPPPVSYWVSERPKVTACTRLQVAEDGKGTTLRHESFEPGPVSRFLLPLLDGTKTHEALEAAVTAAIAEGTLEAEVDEEGAPRPVADLVAESLESLRAMAILLDEG